MKRRLKTLDAQLMQFVDDLPPELHSVYHERLRGRGFLRRRLLALVLLRWDAEDAAQEEGGKLGFDPMTIAAIISVIIALVRLWLEWKERKSAIGDYMDDAEETWRLAA